MKILALMMFLASSLAFSHPADPADLVDSASPACQEIASTLVECRKVQELREAMKASSCAEGSNVRYCNLLAVMTAPSCHADMEDYLLCEISEIKKQTVDRLQRIKDVLTVQSFPEILGQGHPVLLLYKYFKKKVEQKETEE